MEKVVNVFLLGLISSGGSAFLLTNPRLTEDNLSPNSRTQKHDKELIITRSKLLKSIGYHRTTIEPIISDADDVTEPRSTTATDHVTKTNEEFFKLLLMLLEEIIRLIDARNSLAYPDNSISRDLVLPKFNPTGYRNILQNDARAFILYLNSLISDEDTFWGSIRDKSLSGKVRQLKQNFIVLLCTIVQSTDCYQTVTITSTEKSPIGSVVTMVTNQGKEQAFAKKLLLSMRTYLLGLRDVIQ